jgi:hypothetical protein
VITKDKTAEMRPVRVAQVDGGLALIDSGLEEGDQVVVDGQYKLQPGSPVQITTPNQPGTERQLTQADETPAQSQNPSVKQSPGQDGTGHHHRHSQGTEQPGGSSPPAMANQG